jgi:hypothetical protein
VSTTKKISASLSVVESTIAGNMASRNGGGIYSFAVVVQLAGSRLQSNQALGGSGGGCFVDDADSFTVDCSGVGVCGFHQNTALGTSSAGGAVW